MVTSVPYRSNRPRSSTLTDGRGFESDPHLRDRSVFDSDRNFVQ